MSKYNHHITDKPSGFPFECYRTHVQKGFPDVMYHWHPELEIIYVRKGTARFHINYDFFNSKEGDIILIQPTYMHSIHPIKNEEQITDTFSINLDNLGRSMIENFSQRYLQPIYNGHFQLTQRITKEMSGYDDIKKCLLDIFSLVNDQSLYYDMLLKARLHEFLYLLFKNRHVNRNYTTDTYQKYEQLKGLIDYINTHYNEQLTIDFLADYFGYSRTHFMSIFRQHTGTSCIEFILQIRLNKSCELLIQTHDSIADIATKVGFSNLSNFNRQFKQRFQLTPKQYRKKFKAKNPMTSGY